jgi:outer membrane protein OmpA-like peptidoglycan-associated protein
MTTNGDMTPRQPDGEEPVEQLFGDVFDLVDETVARITNAEIDEHLRRVLSKKGKNSQPTDLWQAYNADRCVAFLDLDGSVDAVRDCPGQLQRHFLKILPKSDALPPSLTPSQAASAEGLTSIRRRSAPLAPLPGIRTDGDSVSALAERASQADRLAPSRGTGEHRRGTRHHRRMAPVTGRTMVLAATAAAVLVWAAAITLTGLLTAGGAHPVPERPSAYSSQGWDVLGGLTECMVQKAVVFPPNQYQLSNSARADLRSWLSEIGTKNLSTATVMIESRAADTGATAADLRLSRERDQAVAAFLEGNGVLPSMLELPGTVQELDRVVVAVSGRPGCS